MKISKQGALAKEKREGGGEGGRDGGEGAIPKLDSTA